MKEYTRSVLQTIADNTSGYGFQVVRRTKIAEWLRREYDLGEESLDKTLASLLKSYLIHEKEIKGEKHYGLTIDGFRRPEISVI